MPAFLVESYSLAGQAAEAKAAVARATASREGVRHLRTTFIPEDEICLHFVEGPSLAVVRAALDQGAISYDRITGVAESVDDVHDVASERTARGER